MKLDDSWMGRIEIGDQRVAREIVDVVLASFGCPESEKLVRPFAPARTLPWLWGARISTNARPSHPTVPLSMARLSLEQRRTVLWILNLLLQGARTLVMHRQASMFVYQCGESAWTSLLLHMSDEQRLHVRKLIVTWPSPLQQACRNALDQVQRDLPLPRKIW